MRAALLLLPLLTAGCVESLLQIPGESHAAFACRVLDPEQAQTIVLLSWRAPDVDLDTELSMGGLARALANATGRALDDFRFDERDGPAPPLSGWNRTQLMDWSDVRSSAGTDAAILNIVWLDHWVASGDRLAPGSIVVSERDVLQAASRLDVNASDVARVVLMHYAGHALGVVNDGIPVQDPNLQVREGPPNHEPQTGSVMHAMWHQASTMTWAQDAPYERYSEGVAADLQAAAAPGGVCA